MIVFWLLVSVLTLAGLAALLLPLLRRPARVDVDERELRLAVYRDRRREIDTDRVAGRLSADEAHAAIDELAGDAQANLLDEQAGAVPPPGKITAGESRRYRWLAGALTITVPALALLVYLQIGSPGIIGIDPELARGQASPADIAQALDALQRRVREQPDDAQAWTLLARARRVQNDLPGATQAFAEATRLLPQDARLLAEFAETIAASRDGDFSGQPEQLLEQALAVSPDEPKALALMGAAQYRLGHRDRALGYLRRLLAGMDPKSEQAVQIGAVADRIAGEIGAGAARPGATAAPAASTAPAASGSANGVAAASSVVGSVALADALRAQVPADATLFISARLPEGPRMPLAALRLPVGQWPIRYELSDAQAMTPQSKISQAERVVIEARISRSGNAIRQSGDLIGTSAPVKPGSRDVDLQIDQVVP